MPQFLQADANIHINNVRTAAPLYMKGFADMTRRGHILFALMDEMGMFEYNATEAARFYQIKVREPDVRTTNDTTRKIFSNHNAYEQCQVGIRWYEATDTLTEIQWKLNQGKTSLINLYEQKMKDLGIACKSRLQEWAYRDGNVTPYTDGFQGFESALADDGNTVAADKVALPSDSYAGQSTALANFGGSWPSDLSSGQRANAQLSNDWPYSIGMANYDANSPLLLNWSSSSWGAGSGLWEDNCEEVLREGSAIMQTRNGYLQTGDVPPVVYLLNTKMYTGIKNFYSQRFRMIQPYRDQEVGFPSQATMTLDGVVVKADGACPANTFYGLCPQHTELFWMICMNASTEDGTPMFDIHGPSWDEATGAYLMRIMAGGNLRMFPKFMIKGKNYATPS